MSRHELRVGVIGKGFGSRVVAPAFDQTDGCKVVEVVSPRDRSTVAELCSRADIDLVSVHSPPFLHLDDVRQAVQAGRAVLCDKPFGRNAEEAAAMLDLARSAEVPNFLNFEMRYDPAQARLRDLVNAGAVGEPLRVSCTGYLGVTRVPLRRYGWIFDADLGGGWIGAWGSHAIDSLRWTFGEITQASAERQTAIAERPDADGRLQPCTAEDGFTAVLRSETGVTMTVESTSAGPVNLPVRMSVLGTEAMLELTGSQRIVRYDADGPRDVFSAAGAPDLTVAMRRWAEVVRDAIRAGNAPEGAPTFVDGLACAQVMDRLRN